MPLLEESPISPAVTRPLLWFRPWYASLGCYDEIIVEGPRGTTKTTGILAWIYDQMRRIPMLRVLFLRSTRTRLSEGALVTWEQEVLGPGHPLVVGASREHRSKYVLPNGSEAVCGGLDDLARYQSTPWDIIYVNELGEGVTEEQWESLGGSQRARLIPGQAKRWGDSKRIGDINPVSPGHWTNKRCDPFPDRLRPRIGAINSYPQALTMDMYAAAQIYNTAPTKAKTKRIVTYHADNISYFDQDAWAWTAEGFSYASKQLDKLSGHQRARWLEGRWRAAEGGVFPEFLEDKHVIDQSAISDWPVYIAYDPGFDHPCAVVFVTVAPDGQLIVCDEIYGSGMSLEQVAEKIHDKTNRRRYNVVCRLADPNYAFSQTQHASGRSIAEQMRQDHGLDFTRWAAAKGAAKTAQVEALRSKLTCELPIQFFRTCVNTINEMQSWAFKRMSDGSIPQGDDAYEDRNNHAIDALMGIIARRPEYGDGQASLVRRR